MAPPTGSDGASRALEFTLPSAGVVMIVAFVKEAYGGLAAGLIYLVLTAAILGGIYFSAKYWNTIYTAGFVVSAVILWAMIPGIIGKLVNPAFGTISQFMTIGFFVLMAKKTVLDKIVNGS